jgi:tRNA(adenine34) deaminase
VQSNNCPGQTDIYWLQQAIKLAKRAQKAGEVPVGAVVVLNNKIIGRGYNKPITKTDPTAHAEIVALRAAAKKVGNYRLVNAALYVTLEPCAMCLGAMIQARIKHLVFGAYDPKAGAVNSVFKLLDQNKLNHKIHYTGGLLAAECGKLLTDFFRARRTEKY